MLAVVSVEGGRPVRVFRDREVLLNSRCHNQSAGSGTVGYSIPVKSYSIESISFTTVRLAWFQDVKQIFDQDALLVSFGVRAHSLLLITISLLPHGRASNEIIRAKFQSIHPLGPRLVGSGLTDFQVVLAILLL